MITCSKIIEFDSAHRVFSNEKSKCEKLHGHRYKAEITLQRYINNLDDNGMVFDFTEIKKLIKTWIDINWDHNVILSNKDKQLAIDIEKNTGQKVYLVENPTAEILAKELFNICNAILNKFQVKCIEVKIFETPTSYAIYNQK